MPAGTPDKGMNHFEMRTGLNGFPPLGGMYRSGDPTTVPQHKLHLGVNIRITPAGTSERPGLAQMYDTGVAECIDGLTETTDDMAGSLMLYPGGGATVSTGGGYAMSPASLRLIFPSMSTDHSEFVFALYGSPDPDSGDPQPVVAFPDAGLLATTLIAKSHPFLFAGKICWFIVAPKDAAGGYRVALVSMDTPEKSGELAVDCWRSLANQSVLCPTVQDAGEKWPYGHPYGGVRVLSWIPDLAAWGGTAETWNDITQIVAIPERSVDLLSGKEGVHEILYVIVSKTIGGVLKSRLFRFDGITWTIEYPSIPDDLAPFLGKQRYGPYVVGVAAPGTAIVDCWGAYRGQAGVWALMTFDPALVTICPPGPYTGGGCFETIDFSVAMDRSGSPLIVGGGVIQDLGATEHGIVWYSDSLGDYNIDTATGGIPNSYESWYVLGAVWQGPTLRILGWGTDHDGFDGPWVFLRPGVGDGFVNLWAPAAPGDPLPWVQNVGGRIYFGGSGWTPTPEDAHVVYDATIASADPVLVYGLTAAGAAITGETIEYSAGCLATSGGDDAATEGLGVELGSFS